MKAIDRYSPPIDGAALRAELVEAGLIREGEPLAVLRLRAETPVVRLDEQGLAIAQREIKRGRKPGRKLPNGWNLKAI